MSRRKRDCHDIFATQVEPTEHAAQLSEAQSSATAQQPPGGGQQDVASTAADERTAAAHAEELQSQAEADDAEETGVEDDDEDEEGEEEEGEEEEEDDDDDDLEFVGFSEEELAAQDLLFAQDVLSAEDLRTEGTDHRCGAFDIVCREPIGWFLLRRRYPSGRIVNLEPRHPCPHSQTGTLLCDWR
jgi:hypothetical protein